MRLRPREGNEGFLSFEELLATHSPCLIELLLFNKTCHFLRLCSYGQSISDDSEGTGLRTRATHSISGFRIIELPDVQMSCDSMLVALSENRVSTAVAPNRVDCRRPL